MVNPVPTPLPANADAWQRFVRTLLLGLLVDVAAAVGGVLAVQLPGVHWTRDWWTGLGLLVVSTVVKAVASYIGRFVKPPTS